MTKLALVPALFGILIGASACTTPAPDGTAAPDGVATESDLSVPTTCDQNQLFVKQGLAQDMRDTLGATFVRDYQVTVPGALIAYDGYGGDMIQAPIGAHASAARVFDVAPGGAFSATVGGSRDGDKFGKRGYAAANAVFAAMTHATQKSSTDQGWTTTTRTSKGGRFSCEQRTQGGVIQDASCSFGDLLMINAVSWPKSAKDFCVQ